MTRIPVRSGIRLTAILLMALAVLPAPGRAAVIHANPSNYRTLLESLNAVDTMVLEAGTYVRGLPISNKSGTAAQPILIAGPDDQSAVFTADDCCDTVQLNNASFVEIRNLTLDGAGSRATPVPEPGTFGLLAAGIAAVVAVRLIKRK